MIIKFTLTFLLSLSTVICGKTPGEYEKLMVAGVNGKEGRHGELIYYGTLDTNGSFEPALFASKWKKDSLGIPYLDTIEMKQDSLKLISQERECKGVQWQTVHFPETLIKGTPQLHRWEMIHRDCIDAINFIHLRKWDTLPVAGNNFFFSDIVDTVSSNNIDTVMNLSSLTPLDSQIISEIETHEKSINRPGDISFPPQRKENCIKEDYIDINLTQIRFNRYSDLIPQDRNSSRVILINEKIVWPHSHWNFSWGGGEMVINPNSEEYSPWYQWRDMLFNITYHYQGHLVCSILIIKNGVFKSHKIFDYTPDCG